MLGKIEGERRGWDSWMASPTQWTWVWVNSRSWLWWTGRPGVLQSMGSQSQTWLSDWTELKQVLVPAKLKNRSSKLITTSHWNQRQPPSCYYKPCLLQPYWFTLVPSAPMCGPGWRVESSSPGWEYVWLITAVHLTSRMQGLCLVILLLLGWKPSLLKGGGRRWLKQNSHPLPMGWETSPTSAVPPASNSLSLLCGKRSESVVTVQPCPLSWVTQRLRAGWQVSAEYGKHGAICFLLYQ